MKLIPLSQTGKNKGKYFAQVDDADYDYLMQWRWSVAIQSDILFYAKRSGDCMAMHRLLLGLTETKIYGEHVDGNGLNCQRYNLRKSDANGNNKNRRKVKSANKDRLVVGCHNIERSEIDRIAKEIGW